MLPPNKLGPWGFRQAAKADHTATSQPLWTPQKPADGTRRVTAEEVSRHNCKDGCWVIISGKVYDITEWAPHHPGGAGVARTYASKDATAEFGDFQSPAAIAHIAHFYIGELSDLP